MFKQPIFTWYYHHIIYDANLQKENTGVVGALIVLIFLLGLMTLTTIPTLAKKTGNNGLSQVPSSTTDFPEND